MTYTLMSKSTMSPQEIILLFAGQMFLIIFSKTTTTEKKVLSLFHALDMHARCYTNSAPIAGTPSPQSIFTLFCFQLIARSMRAMIGAVFILIRSKSFKLATA